MKKAFGMLLVLLFLSNQLFSVQPFVSKTIHTANTQHSINSLSTNTQQPNTGPRPPTNTSSSTTPSTPTKPTVKDNKTEQNNTAINTSTDNRSINTSISPTFPKIINKTTTKNKSNTLTVKKPRLSKPRVKAKLSAAIKGRIYSNSSKPLVKPERIEQLRKLKNLSVVKRNEKLQIYLHANRTCEALRRMKLSTIRTSNYQLAKGNITLEELNNLTKQNCILKVAEANYKKEFVKDLKSRLREETKQEIKKLKLNRTSQDAISLKKINAVLLQDGWKPKPGQSSPYQRFVTPNNSIVIQESKGLSKEQIYEKITKQTMWISDFDLTGQAEKWLTPEEFLAKTKQYPTNPIQGISASDCSEQANTLVSMLRASGVAAEDVRVTLGLVNFSGSVGGHAWVEIKDNERWTVLDPTAGPYYNLETGMLNRSGVPYDYWRYHEYPILEVWAYYNDVYYTDKAAEVASGWSQNYDAEKNLEHDLSFFAASAPETQEQSNVITKIIGPYPWSIYVIIITTVCITLTVVLTILNRGRLNEKNN